MKAIYNNIEMDISIDNSLFKQARELYIKTFKDSEMFCDVVLNDAFAISMDIENNKVVTCAFVREKRIRVAAYRKS